jgi:hypothetical protein
MSLWPRCARMPRRDGAIGIIGSHPNVRARATADATEK